MPRRRQPVPALTAQQHRSWRSLAADLHARGLPRRAGDTRATMAARLAAAPAPGQVVQVAVALSGPGAALDALAPALRRAGGRRVAAETALISPRALPGLRRAARRAGVTIAGTAPVAVAGAPPAWWAAANFVLRLGPLLGWPPSALPAALAAVPAPTNARQSAQAEGWVRAWLAAVDAALDPLAGEAPPPLHAGVPAPSPAADVRAAILRALEIRQPLRIRYNGAPGRLAAHRTVEPAQLLGHNRAPLTEAAISDAVYLSAWCRTRQAMRLFRIDRILSAEPEPA